MVVVGFQVLPAAILQHAMHATSLLRLTMSRLGQLCKSDAAVRCGTASLPGKLSIAGVWRLN
jgi:hypothetical protein